MGFKLRIVLVSIISRDRQRDRIIVWLLWSNINNAYGKNNPYIFYQNAYINIKDICTVSTYILFVSVIYTMTMI